MTAPIYQIPVRKIDGSAGSLGEFAGDVLLVVNVASACGLTPQYVASSRSMRNIATRVSRSSVFRRTTSQRRSRAATMVVLDFLHVEILGAVSDVPEDRGEE